MLKNKRFSQFVGKSYKKTISSARILYIQFENKSFRVYL